MTTLSLSDVEITAATPQTPTTVTDQTMTLEDGRKLGFGEYGDPSGKPVFFFHGGAGSRLEHPADQCAIGARIIGVDRPGHGLSDSYPDRELLDWPKDIAQLADLLGITKCYVLGWSAGGPYALACAHRLPEVVVAGAVAAGIAPMQRPRATRGMGLSSKLFVATAQRSPWMIGTFRKMAREAAFAEPAKAKRRLMAAVTDIDKEFMLRSGNLEMWLADVSEAYRQGWQGIALDDIILMNNWGFDLSEITVPIDLWHGEQDRNVPFYASEYMDQRIPNARLRILPGEGHLFLLKHWGKVIVDLITGGSVVDLSSA
jgi:pimeloyl-ACP methyl ester carboxylesterase